MKPKTIIAMLGVLTLLVAFTGMSYAGSDDDAKAARAVALRDCKANGTAMCPLSLKATSPNNFNMCCQLYADGFFKSVTDLKNVIEKYPGSVIASGQLLADGSSKTMAVTKATLPNLDIKVNTSEISSAGAVTENVIEVNLVKEPISKLVVYDKSAIEDGGIIISTSSFMESTLAAGGECTGSDCCPVEDIEFLDPAGAAYLESVWDFEAIQAFLETAIGALLDGFCIYDADGVCIDIDWAGIAALLDDAEWGLVFDAMAEYLPSAEVLTDFAIGEAVIEMRECYLDEYGVLRSTTISDPEEAGASLRRTVATEAATEIVGEKIPAPGKCLIMCDYNKDGDCLDPLEPECNACNQPDNCDLIACPSGCFDNKIATCLAPACYNPQVMCGCLCPGQTEPWACKTPVELPCDTDPYDCIAELCADDPVCGGVIFD